MLVDHLSCKHCRGYASVIAFVVGGEYRFGNGYVVVGSHTDSPCLKVRPVSALTREGFKQARFLVNRNL